MNYIKSACILISIVLVTIISIDKSYGKSNLEKWINRQSSFQYFNKSNQPLFSKHIEIIRDGKTEALPKLILNENAFMALKESSNPNISIELPYANNTLQLKLTKVKLLSSDFTLGELTQSGRKNLNFVSGAFYRGIVENDSNSIAVLSVFDHELNLWICTNNKTVELTPDKDAGNLYQFKQPLTEAPYPSFNCEALNPPNANNTLDGNTTQSLSCSTIGVYMECDNKFYKDFNSNSNSVMQYVSSIFNQVAALYQNEQIQIVLTGINVWTTPDPYASYTSITELLGAFKNTNGSNFNGTISHLLTTRQLGGGVSYTDVLCNKNYAHGVSCIYPYYSNAPTYSWTVEVIAHELGHNFGSNHTHWCGWVREDGSTGALDNCFMTEGNCPPGPSPVNGGTIMSYCHLTGGGINFSNGFGIIPGNFIRNRVMNAGCLNSAAATPELLSTNDITSNTAVLSWYSGSSYSNFQIQYRLKGSNNWTDTIIPNSSIYELRNLKTGTTYEWRIKTICSDFGPTITFSTLKAGPCDIPENVLTTSTNGNSISISWEKVDGVSAYLIQYKPIGSQSWITADSVNGNKLELNGLLGATSYWIRLKTNCSEFTAPIQITTASSGCPLPSTVAANNITTNSVKLNWNSAEGASLYTIYYKASGESKWTAITSAQSSQVLTGLMAGTTYEWKVKSNCSTATTSTTFQTLALPSIQGEYIQLSPNPATDRLNIRCSPTEEFGNPQTVIIFNMIGKEILRQNFEGLQLLLDIALIPDGIYFAQVEDFNGHSCNKRFLKH